MLLNVSSHGASATLTLMRRPPWPPLAEPGMEEESTTFWFAARAMARTTATRSVSYMRRVTRCVGSRLTGLASSRTCFFVVMAACSFSILRGWAVGV